MRQMWYGHETIYGQIRTSECPGWVTQKGKVIFLSQHMEHVGIVGQVYPPSRNALNAKMNRMNMETGINTWSLHEEWKA
jgi:hypothetical protein